MRSPNDKYFDLSLAIKSFNGMISVYSIVLASCMNVREMSNVGEVSDSGIKSSMNKLEAGLTFCKLFLDDRTCKKGARFSW